MGCPEGYVETQHKYNDKHQNKLDFPYYETQNFAKTVAAWIKSSPFACDSILDAGCRSGHGIEALATHFPAAEIVGIDIVPEFVALATQRGEAVVGDLCAMPFEDEQFDWTFSSVTIEHCYDLPTAIEEMRRVSKFGFFVRTDLEDTKSFDGNPSHFSHHENPLDWANEFKHPEWMLVSLTVPNPFRVEMVWLRKEQVARLTKE